MKPTRRDLLSAYDAALRAANPRAAVGNSMSLIGSVLTVGNHQFDDVVPDGIVIVAIGKAAAAMATGASAAVGASRGLVVTSFGASAPYRVCIGSHPIPDQTSLRCGSELLSFVAATQRSDVVVFLVSGGGSAVATVPIEGVSIADIAETNRLLIASGMPIEEINEVRSSLSLIKGGGLSKATTAKRQATLIMSDVVGAGPAHVASGPSIGFSLGCKAGRVIEGRGLRGDLPDSVVAAIDGSQPVVTTDTPIFDVIGSPEIAAKAAAADLRCRGFDASVGSTQIRGEARSEAVALIDTTPPGVIAVAAGETTVMVRGGGVGGRNQEAALAAALHMDGRDVLFGALGTDGIDGPTEAAGAIVDGTTAAKARHLGVDLEAALWANDSHTVLTALGETVITGPSGTNVADLWFVAKGPF